MFEIIGYLIRAAVCYAPVALFLSFDNMTVK